jgi:HPr kinase/phosphorylase
MTLLHGTCVAVDGHGVLLRGQPGAGKSDLALRLIGDGAVLVADDQVSVEAAGDILWSSAPPAIRGLLEVRGVGLVRTDTAGRTPVRLIVDLVPRELVPRLPETAYENLEGIELPVYRLHAFDGSTPAKIALLVRALGIDIIADR